MVSFEKVIEWIKKNILEYIFNRSTDEISENKDDEHLFI